MGPRKIDCSSPGLSIEFDHARHHYSPGDVITGRVSLHTVSETSIGRVAVEFWGRAKSRIIQSHGQSATFHRGRMLFFRQEKTLYQGQYTHKPGTFSWPFEFVVPEQADPICILNSESWKPKEDFMSTHGPDLDLSLPMSMYHKSYSLGRQADCYIEYVLEASVTEPEGVHTIRKPQTKTATYPIILHPLSTPEPIQDYEYVTDSYPVTISTLKLLPENNNAGTTTSSIREAARSIFQRDTIPRFSFKLTIQAPSIIQLFHPEPIPFRIRAIPDLRPEHTTIDLAKGDLPEVTLKSARLKLKTYIRCRAPGTYDDSKSYEISLLSTKQVDRPLLPQGLSANDTVVDLGQLFNLHLGNATVGSRLEEPLCPSFTTYNISRSYRLLWDLEVECAGKTNRFSSSRHGIECIVILPAATTTALPAYQPEGQALDMLQDLHLAPTSSMGSTTDPKSGSGGSSRWWSSARRRQSSTAKRTYGVDSDGKSGKATFGPLDSTTTSAPTGTDVKDTEKKRVLTKEEEAAQDRVGDTG
ncbi:hypothetical protein HRR83_003595 [Exophiala dermatitidis]|uniref:Arrestin-like N-terminal domain-containing protein n=2 Tax=Exophiala dermatitidis TaxID=5970 RepID=H6BSN6_EXODN|nr:uncharacterized protein HMPREF1120_01582 [Exophiala dermatitidis NIH/UT8656]KAJ4519094.1 hypothetical protein HRR75_002772 [Exophiala dermatitidis]EHY53388.1 hypothetical protein HMPREF1120_01582 [Exophiala dermatitidis NIH/UT8656]KAJ4522440.1 hypothetical protein HRR74_003025 [Exophiala dermatitidis]KAJ4529765.1 hypothetical protein HRR73_000793 [Exophiala dermatitidis]KAJ4543068.1 hypothetical protein HRR77_005328 [Exophiala dermatitidis]